MTTSRWCWTVVLFVAAPVLAQPLGPEVRPFVALDAPVFVLRHVRVIDGTGAAPPGGPVGARRR